MTVLLFVALSWADPWCDAVAADLEAGTLFDADHATAGTVRDAVFGIGPYIIVPFVRHEENPQAADLEACAARHQWPRAMNSPIDVAFMAHGAQLSFLPTEAGDDGVISIIPPPPRGREPGLLGRLSEASEVLDQGIRQGVPAEDVALLREGLGVEVVCEQRFDAVCRGFVPMSTADGCALAVRVLAIAAGAEGRPIQSVELTCDRHRALATVTRDGAMWTAQIAAANRFHPLGAELGTVPIRIPVARTLTAAEHGGHVPTNPEAWEEVLRHASQTSPSSSESIPGLRVGIQLAERAGLPAALVLAAVVNPGPYIDHRREYRGRNPYTCLGYGFLAAGMAVTSGRPTLDHLFCVEEHGLRQKGSIVVGFGEGDARTVIFGWIGDDLGLPWHTDARSVEASVVGDLLVDPE